MAAPVGGVYKPPVLVQANDYDPWGLDISSFQQPNHDNFKYSGKEQYKDFGLDWYDFGARMYDAPIGRWHAVDPLADIARRFSPYVYGNNNPLRFIDPSGMAAEAAKDFTYSDGYSTQSYGNSSGVVGISGAYSNPIYDNRGNLLGTDDKGLQGQAIVMKKENFQQGMKHEDAVRNNLGEAGLISKNALAALLFSLNGLSKRPDYDGELSLDEANQWYREGKGEALFVNAEKIDLSPVHKSDFNKIGQSIYKNFAFTTNTITGLVYGTIKLTLITDKGNVKLGGNNGLLDTYDFDYKEGIKNIPRNIATWLGEKKAGNGIPYCIYNYNTGKVK